MSLSSKRFPWTSWSVGKSDKKKKNLSWSNFKNKWAIFNKKIKNLKSVKGFQKWKALTISYPWLKLRSLWKRQKKWSHLNYFQEPRTFIPTQVKELKMKQSLVLEISWRRNKNLGCQCLVSSILALRKKLSLITKTGLVIRRLINLLCKIL